MKNNKKVMESLTAVCFTDMHRLQEIKWRNGTKKKEGHVKVEVPVLCDAGQEGRDAILRETPWSDRINTDMFATWEREL